MSTMTEEQGVAGEPIEDEVGDDQRERDDASEAGSAAFEDDADNEEFDDEDEFEDEDEEFEDEDEEFGDEDEEFGNEDEEFGDEESGDEDEGFEDEESDDEDEFEDDDEESGDEDEEFDDEDEESDDEDEEFDDEDDQEIRFRYFGMTDVGLIREHNEDNFVVVDLAGEGPVLVGGEHPEPADPEPYDGILDGGLVLAVCDGMGGAAAGEVASQMAVDTIHEVMLDAIEDNRDRFAHRLVHSVEDAGSRIFSAAKMDRSRRGMGTTSTVAGFIDDTLFVGQVGDSRCYVLREGQLSLVTKDQSLVNQLIEAGQLTEEEAEQFEHSNIILQALGTTEDVSVDLTFLELRQGDRIMLCSDGLSGLVHAEMIREVMSDGDDIKAICARLVEMANAGGGHDNITCIICDVEGPGLKAPGDDAQLGYFQYPLPALDAIGEDGPAQEMTIKPGGRKPGADVKGAPRSGSASGGTQGFPWWIVVVVFAVLGIFAAVIGVGSGDGDDASPAEQAPSTVSRGSAPEASEVPVLVDGDFEGQLWIDGEERGAFSSGAALRLRLAPGAYRFEGRIGGDAVARQTVTVGADPVHVVLEMPEGNVGSAVAEPEASDEIVVVTSDPEPEPAEEEPSRDNPSDSERPVSSASGRSDTPRSDTPRSGPTDAPRPRPQTMRSGNGSSETGGSTSPAGMMPPSMAAPSSMTPEAPDNPF